ncbi:Leiomodin-2 [Manis javanica]|nr:Leiomodin-2 [Manis javanica]
MTLLQSLHLGPCLSGPLGSCKHAADLEPSPRAGRLVAVGQLQLHFIILGGLGMQAPKAHREGFHSCRLGHHVVQDFQLHGSELKIVVVSYWAFSRGISRQVVRRKRRDKVTFEQGGNGGTNSLRGSPTGAPFAVPRDRRAAVFEQ